MSNGEYFSGPSVSDLRPHMVMAVGNLVIGDSRVEKAAISARDLGYKVTVVGVRRRTVQQISFIDGDIPIIRLPVSHEHHDAIAVAVQKREDRLARRRRRINRLRQPYKRPAYLAHRLAVRARESRVRVSRRLGRSWRKLWPHLTDYEKTFFNAFQALEPDIIHVHDRHPLPGAAKYDRWADETLGVRPVRWLYDAHEFVPTQHIPPPAEHEQAWIAAERECIQRADAVVTVSDQLAELLQQHHNLVEIPTVVRNLPSTVQASNNPLRTDVRSSLGLSLEVPIAVYAGGITPQRGLATLLDAQLLVTDLHVAIICKDDAELRGRLLQQSRRLGTKDRLHLLDYVPASHVSRFLSTADVGVSALLPSAAHQAAAPTKVSEYLHAGLPVVVSDMRAQAERVRRLGFGLVYPSGDAEAMARALRTVLNEPSKFRNRITDEVIRANSWEADASGLETVWARLVPPDRQVQPKWRPEGSVIKITGHGAESTWGPAFEAVAELTSTSGTLPRCDVVADDLTNATFVLTGDGLRFLDFWRHEVSQVKAVLYERPISLVDNWAPALTTGILTMSGKPALRLLPGTEIYDIDRLRSAYPHHWLHEITEAEENQLRSEFRGLRQSIAANDRHVISDCLRTSWLLGGVCTFLPAPTTPVVNLTTRSAHHLPHVGWFVDERRSKAELAALHRLRSTVGSDARVSKITTASHNDLERFDIIIDSLSEDMPTPNGLRAMAAGCVIISGSGDELSKTGLLAAHNWFLNRLPLLHTSPDELLETVTGLLRDRTDLDDWRHRSRSFGVENLSTSAVTARLLALLSFPVSKPGSGTQQR